MTQHAATALSRVLQVKIRGRGGGVVIVAAVIATQSNRVFEIEHNLSLTRMDYTGAPGWPSGTLTQADARVYARASACVRVLPDARADALDRETVV
jgi:hypothetical protein